MQCKMSETGWFCRYFCAEMRLVRGGPSRDTGINECRKRIMCNAAPGVHRPHSGLFGVSVRFQSTEKANRLGSAGFRHVIRSGDESETHENMSQHSQMAPALSRRYQSLMDGKVRPFRAAIALFRLTRDKDDAGQVDIFKTSVDGNWYEPTYKRFADDPYGAALLRRHKQLLEHITDVDRLRKLPANSLGNLYIKQLDARGISPQGFREANLAGEDFSLLPAQWQIPHYRIYDIHDLLHTAVGWGRDPLGEVCILEFQGIQHRSRGLRVLSFLAGTEIKRRYPDTPVYKCIKEANHIAKQTKGWVLTYPWEERLEYPIERVREELNLRTPETYMRQHDIWQIRDEKERLRIARAKARKR